MEEMRENPRLAGGVELCEEMLHFCRGIGIKGDDSNLQQDLLSTFNLIYSKHFTKLFHVSLSQPY